MADDRQPDKWCGDSGPCKHDPWPTHQFLQHVQATGTHQERKAARILMRVYDRTHFNQTPQQPDDRKVECCDCGGLEYVEAVYCRRCESNNRLASKENGRKQGAAVAFGLCYMAENIRGSR